MTIHAMILARDEAANLVDCVASLRALTSDITVFDTGSVDQTPELARRIGVPSRNLPWNDDFAAARNAALEEWTSGWILVVDADERLSVGSVAAIAQAVETAPEATGMLPLEVRTWTEDVEQLGFVGTSGLECQRHGAAGYVLTPEPRLFRAGVGWHYVGRVGERLCDASGHTPSLALKPVGVLHHLREEQCIERRRQRSRRHIALALRQVLETQAPQAAAQLGALLNAACRWREALSYLRDAEAAPGAGIAVHMQAGVARLHLGLTDGAEASFQRAWVLSPGHPEVATWLARAQLQRPGDLSEACALLEEAHAEAPDLDLAVVLLAQVHRRRGELSTARGWLQALLETNPVHPLALKEQGAVALLQDRAQEAEEHLRQALRLRPHDTDILNNLGCALERMGYWDEALAAFTQGLLHASSDTRLLRNRCIIQACMQRRVQFLEDVGQLMLLSDTPEEDFLVLRDRLLDGGWIDALRDLEEWATRAGWRSDTALLDVELDLEEETVLEAL